MATMDLTPTDSVLRRHALTEYHRELGLPPSDSVLQRHYAQLQSALHDGTTHSPEAQEPTGTAAPAAPAAHESRLLAWLRRMLRS